MRLNLVNIGFTDLSVFFFINFYPKNRRFKVRNFLMCKLIVICLVWNRKFNSCNLLQCWIKDFDSSLNLFRILSLVHRLIIWGCIILPLVQTKQNHRIILTHKVRVQLILLLRNKPFLYENETTVYLLQVKRYHNYYPYKNSRFQFVKHDKRC